MKLKTQFLISFKVVYFGEKNIRWCTSTSLNDVMLFISFEKLMMDDNIFKRSLLQKHLAGIHLDTKAGFSFGDALNLFIAAGEKHKPDRKEQWSS